MYVLSKSHSFKEWWTKYIISCFLYLILDWIKNFFVLNNFCFKLSLFVYPIIVRTWQSIFRFRNISSVYDQRWDIAQNYSVTFNLKINSRQLNLRSLSCFQNAVSFNFRNATYVCLLFMYNTLPHSENRWRNILCCNHPRSKGQLSIKTLKLFVCAS